MNKREQSMDKQRRTIVAAAGGIAVLAVTGCTTTSGTSGDPAEQRRALNAGADEALSRLYSQQPGSRELIASAKGYLVFPSQVSAGFLVGGGSGQGVLRTGGKTTGFYRMTEASVGLLAGAQSQAVFILFMTDEALKRFEASNGWTVGADANVSMINVGANATLNTTTTRQEVIGFVMTNGGLMGNLSLNGNRVTRLPL
jgi:lipid-binding SYLF domain-containing protein